MKITYAICVCTESRELNDLLNFLTHVKDEEDDINILVDSSKVTDDVRNILSKYKNLSIFERKFCGNFAEHRNYHGKLCKGDYIFAIDADEIPRENLIKSIKHIIKSNEAELIYIPRINIIPGYTDKWLKQYNFKINEVGWINWPDFQGRVYKNNSKIHWEKGLHETITGSEKTIALQAIPDLSLWHIKSIEKQDNQDSFYKSIDKN